MHRQSDFGYSTGAPVCSACGSVELDCCAGDGVRFTHKIEIGDLVICAKQRLPHMVALPVFEITRNAFGWRVYAGRPGNCIGAPAEDFIAAPDGWQDPPAWPNGSAAHGQGETHWQAKLAFDDADPAHQERMVEFHAAMLRWLERHGMRINRAEAAGLSEAHRDFLRDATARLRVLRAPAAEWEAA